MDKVKLQEMVKEEVQNLLSEADMRSPTQKLRDAILRIKSADPTSKTYEAAINAVVKELEAISNELEGR